jgi:integrase
VLRRIEARGRHESAQRTRAAISRVFRYGIATGRVTSDPSNPLIGAIQVAKVRHRAAIIEPKGVGELMRAIYGIDNSVVIKAALQLMALCFPRPGELRHAEWSEIDLDKAVWTIPEHRTKMRRPHAIPLPPQAVTIFRDLKEITGHRKLVFPGVRSPLRPLSENTLNATLRRLGYTVDEMTAHGFRTIASTLLNESGKWNPDAVERALAHQEGNAVRRAYARGAYWDERVKMAKWWANHLDHLREQSPVETKRASGRKNSSPRKIAA